MIPSLPLRSWGISSERAGGDTFVISSPQMGNVGFQLLFASRTDDPLTPPLHRVTGVACTAKGTRSRPERNGDCGLVASAFLCLRRLATSSGMGFQTGHRFRPIRQAAFLPPCPMSASFIDIADWLPPKSAQRGGSIRSRPSRTSDPKAHGSDWGGGQWGGRLMARRQERRMLPPERGQDPGSALKGPLPASTAPGTALEGESCVPGNRPATDQ